MLIKDEATTFRFTYLLKSKDEVYDHLRGFIPMVKNMNNAQIKHFRFDNGTELVNRRITDLLKNGGIQIENIVPYTPEQNGRIERDNRTIQESARTMLIASGLPKRTATYLLNRTTNSRCPGSTPYEKWFDRKPYLDHIKIFGTECFVQIPKQNGRKKWGPKAKKVFLVGFEHTIKNFRLYDPQNRRVHMSCDVRFNEKQPEENVFTTHDESEGDDELDGAKEKMNENADESGEEVFESANETLNGEQVEWRAGRCVQTDKMFVRTQASIPLLESKIHRFYS